jgi:tetratricopeptide (TPR) repeat protein
MTTRKRLKKRQMKEDQLVTTALKVSNFVQERFSHVITGVVVLIVIVAIVLFASQARKNSGRAAERDFAVAMNQYQTGQLEQAGTAFASLADQHSGRRSGKAAMYFLGETRMAQYRYQEALEAYDRYLDKAGDSGEFSHPAMIAKGLCYEGLGQFRMAAELMDSASKLLGPDDARYYDVLFNAGTFHWEAGNATAAAEFFRRVSEEATGPLKDRATMWLSRIQ